MNRFWFKSSLILLIVSAVGLAMLLATDQAQAWQEAFVQSDVYATVIYTDPINVRGGPSTVFYPIVGRLSPGDVVPALGVSPGSEWVQIAYPDAPGGVGWVYATYVSISGGELGIVEPPPTQTPIATATVNPTFAAAFIFEPTTTQLPTFTPPPPLEIPQFSDASASRPSGLSSGIVIIGLLLIGAAGLVITSALRKQ
ncbi:MAG: hypothetical protein C3F07_13325 [Anaerolineales bacterium]|nr:MAG: hypothetical protein C3F07_13325 [Anaerolineales bacterium]